MQVVIDGVQFIPAPPVCEKPEVLEFRCFISDLGRDVSLREYFHALLSALWAEQESFSGKRPFGNSGWDYDVYLFLIKAGVVAGQLDEHGYIETVDAKAADAMIPGLIAAAFNLKA